MIREPLVHFFVLGALLFAIFSWINPDTITNIDVVMIDENRVQSLRTQFERARQRQPTTEELTTLIDSWVREEILYREGLTLGLDLDDSFIRQRIAQKMSLMADSLADTSFTEKDLQGWLKDNELQYRFEARISFRQIFIDPKQHDDAIDSVISNLRSELTTGAGKDLGDTTSLPAEMTDTEISLITRIFGSEFVAAIEGIPLNQWHGPVQSVYGLHFVFIDSVTPGRNATLDEVRTALERDLMAERTRIAEEIFYSAIREKYSVQYTNTANNLVASPAK